MFGQNLDNLSKPQCYASEASKAVCRSLTEATDILNQHGRLKELVTKCPYLLLKGGPLGGTYLFVLDVKGQLSGKLTLFFKLSMVSLWPVIYLSGEISDISTNLIFL